MVVMEPTGDIAVQQRNLILTAIGLMLLVVAPVLAMIVLFAWRYRQSNTKKVYDPSFTHSGKLEVLIWGWPIAIIIALATVTITSTYRLDPFRPLDRIAPGKPVPAGVKPLEVQVVALDWKWLFIYPDLGVASVNELALPVDVPVHFSITSESQFNTFEAPTLAGMVYAMPGMKSQLNAVLNAPGDSWGYSGNYTGAGFSDMRFKLKGLAEADFNQWIAAAKKNGGALNTAGYIALEHPSAKTPVAYYATVQPQLFDQAVNACVTPGQPCTEKVIEYDQTHAGAAPVVPTPSEEGVGSRVSAATPGSGGSHHPGASRAAAS